MLTRRTSMTMIGSAAISAAILVAPTPLRHAWAQSPERAITFVKTTSDQLIAIVNGAGSLQEKRRELRAILDSSVDVDDIARFCLGRFWGTATQEQQTEYVAMFHDLLVDKIANRLGAYRGAKVIMGQARASADTEIVITQIDRPGAEASRIDWVVGRATGSPMIVDLLAEGTSLRVTQASDFGAYLARHQYSVRALIDGMRQVVAQIQ